MYDPVSHLVQVTRGDDVRTTLVDRRVLMCRMTTLDEDAERPEARTRSGRVREAVGR